MSAPASQQASTPLTAVKSAGIFLPELASIIASYLDEWTFTVRPIELPPNLKIMGNVCYHTESDPNGGGDRITEWLLFGGFQSNKFFRYCVSSGKLSVLAGSGTGEFANGIRETAKTAAFSPPNAVRIDPVRRGCWYLSDGVSIRHLNESSDKVKLIAGDEDAGYLNTYVMTNGSLDSLSRFNMPLDMLITADGGTMWVL